MICLSSAICSPSVSHSKKRFASCLVSKYSVYKKRSTF
uniref:Uncharacterized protein n=1 Tax=Arundo donax TaxID=35708 RepID=A0A0A8ZLE9_ARUDO